MNIISIPKFDYGITHECCTTDIWRTWFRQKPIVSYTFTANLPKEKVVTLYSTTETVDCASVVLFNTGLLLFPNHMKNQTSPFQPNSHYHPNVSADIVAESFNACLGSLIP
jgi:hypothetical protein